MSRYGKKYTAKVDAVEAVVKLAIEQGIPPVALLIGVHNTFTHGKAFDLAGEAFEDDDLDHVIVGLEMAIDAAKGVYENN